MDYCEEKRSAQGMRQKQYSMLAARLRYIVGMLLRWGAASVKTCEVEVALAWACRERPHVCTLCHLKQAHRSHASLSSLHRLRKGVKKIEISQHSRYTCTFCGKDSVKRKAVGIWECRSCKKVIAGGAWTLSTTAAATVRR